MFENILKILIPTAISFSVGIAITPLISHYLYKYKAWKKVGGKVALDGTVATEFNKLHAEGESKTPRMGGVVIWASTGITVIGIWLLSLFIPNETINEFNFLTRSQTWVPLFALLVGSFVGLLNDIYDIKGRDGLRLRHRLIIVSGLAVFVAWWFYDKLDVVSISIPFGADLVLGWLIIPIFVFISLALYASGVIDGIDGLSGGVFTSIFFAYAGVAFFQNQIDLAALSATIGGSTLAFLWYNIPPARFYMTETGTMGLTLTLAVIALMSDTLGEGNGLLVLPIIAFPLFITVLSNIFQVLSKKFLGRKLFIVAPIHHHFEALGCPGYKVTMRFWVVSAVFALLGMITALVA